MWRVRLSSLWLDVRRTVITTKILSRGSRGSCIGRFSTWDAPRVFRSVDALLDDDRPVVPRTVVLLHGVRFAPNVGASLRALHLLGGEGAIWAATAAVTQDSPQGALRDALRISMATRHGWPLRLAVLSPDKASAAARRCAERGFRLVCIETDTAGQRAPPVALEESNLRHERAVLVFGAEDTGVPPDLEAACHDFVSIRTAARGSLNVSHAVALVLYERRRQLLYSAAGATGEAAAMASATGSDGL